MLACMRVQQPDPAAVLAATCAWQVVLDFIENYFDQNPISQLALIQLREGKAEKITELSGNQRHHKSKLDEYMAKQKYLGHGPASLRAGLEVSSSSDFRCARLCATLTPRDAVLAARACCARVSLFPRMCSWQVLSLKCRLRMACARSVCQSAVALGLSVCLSLPAVPPACSGDAHRHVCTHRETRTRWHVACRAVFSHLRARVRARARARVRACVRACVQSEKRVCVQR
jgi:hypothetical protein